MMTLAHFPINTHEGKDTVLIYKFKDKINVDICV